MSSTRERFYAAISHSPTPVVAAGLVTAMHKATLKEVFEELEAVINHLDEASARALHRLKAEYTA